MKVVTAGEMREIDRISIEEYGIPAEVLMNSAGKAVADFVISSFPGVDVNIVCGTGNNGGDGFTAAYYIHNSGKKVRLILCGSKDRVSPVSRIFMNLCEKCRMTVHEYTDFSRLDELIFNPGLIIDALFGTGFKGVPVGIQKSIIDSINSSGMPVVSVDMPSGLSSDGEPPEGSVIKADYTLTIGLNKISTATYPGKHFCGNVIRTDIGFPSELTNSDSIKVSLLDKASFTDNGLSRLGEDIHKGERGHTLLVGGFNGMEGALLLTASSLFKTGAGLATALTTVDSRSIIAGKIPELMTSSIPPGNPGAWIQEFFSGRRFTTLIIGPGLGRSDISETAFEAVISSAADSGIRRIIIDGDGLFHLARYISNKTLPSGVDYCITPHFMEASRIIGSTPETIRNCRLASCVEIAKKTGCITVLKGPATIISDGDKSFINTTGNSFLATAGSGDVLSGIIGSFMNSSISALNAVCAGVYIHGACADIYASEHTFPSMKAGDIIKNIDRALNLFF